MSEKTKEYVLGTGNDELSRLAVQHRVWADVAVSSWKRAGFGPGSRLLDVGCGPGFATFDLAQLVTETGEITGVDESPPFLEYLKSQAEKRGLPQIKTARANAMDVSGLGADLFDGVYARWLLCWLSDPRAAIEKMRGVLKPGGRLVIHDYFGWKSMGMAPRSPAIDTLVAAAIRSYEERQGNMDVSGRLLGILRETGFEVRHFEPHHRSARGGGVDGTLTWIVQFWRTYAPKLHERKFIDSKTLETALADLARLELDRDCFFVCPTVYEFIAVKN